ncbi:unnamed protein product [Rotaria sp. Silwood1]|nr:unnamed protein product [Rotaria sp. Silwood1]
MDVHVQTDDCSCELPVESSTVIKTTNNEIVTLQLNATSSSHKKCCVCRKDLHGNAVNISSKDRDVLLFSRNIWIPEGARCCSDHKIGDQLSKEAIDAIKPFAIRHQELKSADVQLLLNKSQNHFENEKRRFNFDDPRGLNDDEYPLLTSLSKDDFNELIEIISTSGIRNSSNRSIRTAIGIYLCKLRLGLSNRLLACMFQLQDKRIVSKIIDNARQAILKTFVPYYLGFGHVSRQDVIDHHTTTIARELMNGGGSNAAIVVIDGTYIYIQVRKVFIVLGQIFSILSLEISKQPISTKNI